jgi:hypothetical protein
MKPSSSSSYLHLALKTANDYASNKAVKGVFTIMSLAIGMLLFQRGGRWEPAVAEMVRFVVSAVGGFYISWAILFVICLIYALRISRSRMLSSFVDSKRP